MQMILSAPERFVASCVPPRRLDSPVLWFVFQGSQILVQAAPQGVRIPQARSLADLGLASVRSQYLGALGNVPCFTAEVEESSPAPPGMKWSGLRALFGALDDTVFALAGRAFQIMDWDRSHQFCGRCGTPTQLKPGERARACPRCGQLHYPRIAPAVMALVRRGRDFLLARSPHFPPGMYSALAGFSEPGETLEQTLTREVEEEVGIHVSNLRYFASQPWPFPHSLMIAFHCDYAGGELHPDPMEIEAADWFSAERLPQVLPSPISISRRLIEATLAELRNAR
ncbi:MAG TPA: NAD(+) diphosphatase [Burkholderiales bacterium]|nr:NAD(+) diphosphatase [Burkholderiales bacterium]